MSAPRSSPLTVDGLASLPAQLAELGSRRVLLLTSASRRGVDRVRSLLAGLEVVVFDDVRPHVPAEVVELASAALAASAADTVVALGGGSAIGLGKALRLRHDIRFVAVPTTYAGSEMTSIYGITEGGSKRTGRDDRVRPDLVVHDGTLAGSLSLAESVQSLCNALAHGASALSTNSLSGPDRAAALTGAGELVRVIEELLLWPGSAAVRTRALAAAGQAGRVLDAGTMGVQHKLAHLLGGRFALPHSAVHSALLPAFLSWLRATQPELAGELDAALPLRDAEGELYDLLERAGAPTSLRALGLAADALAAALAEQPELPGELVWTAYWGRRPSASARPFAVAGGPPALHWGPAPAQARRVVVGLHGRGGNAGKAGRTLRALLGHAPDVAVIALQADGDAWYPDRATEDLAEKAGQSGVPTRFARHPPTALARVDACLAALAADVPPERLVLFGFSQGACLALEAVARGPRRAGAVVALAGTRIGPRAEWPAVSAAVAGVPILLGAGDADPWVGAADLAASAAAFAAAGAAVELIGAPGDAHEIGARQRLRARELLAGRPHPPAPVGFGNSAAAEALDGALPPDQNSPRRAPYGLFAEQLNATAFTAPRRHNLRTWTYRVRPSTHRRDLEPLAHATFAPGFVGRAPAVDLAAFAPQPLPAPGTAVDFLDGLVTLGGAGDPREGRGFAVHAYAANRSMEHRALADADGDLLLVPQLGALTLLTELGALAVAPGEIALVPRGLVFSVLLAEGAARGTVGETFARPFRLPERGPIGANGLADARHFRGPRPYYEDRLDPGFAMVVKLAGGLYRATRDFSPFDVVAWHGNHVPYVYDLATFSPVGNTRFDHGDPSVHTVLSAPLDEAGASALDFIAFVPRWDPSEHTFRPPFFHRNVTSELNGVIRDRPPPGSPFVPGGWFLTPSCAPHGVAARAVDRALAAADADADAPARGPDHSLWFQFESSLPFCFSPWTEAAGHRIADWPAWWGAQRTRFPSP